jgi:hypothetical protein
MANWRAFTRQLAQQYDLPFFPAQIQQESGYDPTATSGMGAQGIAQIMPDTAQAWGVDANDPRAALIAAAQHMRGYVDKYGSPEKALAAYNEGEGNLARYGVYGLPETSNYVKTILGQSARSAFVGAPPSAAPSPGGAGGPSVPESPDTAPGAPSPITAITNFNQRMGQIFPNNIANQLSAFADKGSSLAKVLSMGVGGGESSPMFSIQAPASQPPPDFSQPFPTPASPTSQMPLDNVGKWVKIAPEANRSSADGKPLTIHPEVVDFVGHIAQLAGQPLTITTGTNHNQYVLGTNRESDHWTGWAGDIAYGRGTPDNPDPALTRLGQEALIAAGADKDWAHRQTGGFFNINGYNIGFNTMTGGNHFNHLHVGVAH